STLQRSTEEGLVHRPFIQDKKEFVELNGFFRLPDQGAMGRGRRIEGSGQNSQPPPPPYSLMRPLHYPDKGRAFHRQGI
ncbi:MAG: hypothetical protein DRG50_06185, partial [Deltaproteobacteria bacterium]